MKSLITFIGVFVSIMFSSLVIANDVEPKSVLVTGASSGIGLSITKLLSENGYYVYAGARKEEDLKRLDAMKNVQSVRLDVTMQSDIDAAVKLITAKGRGLQGLVNNAGVVLNAPLIELPVEELQWLFDVNVFGVYRVTQAFAPLIIEGKGRIVNIGSITGIYSGVLNGQYSMSKHAVEAFTDSLAMELERFGVKVSVIEPGGFATNAGKTALVRREQQKYLDPNSAYRAELNYLKSMGAKQKGGDPVDVAKAVMLALSSEAPKRRYLVANGKAADTTINKAMERVLQLNQDQPHTKNKEELVKILGEQLQNLD